jgi:hypothetical protein
LEYLCVFKQVVRSCFRWRQTLLAGMTGLKNRQFSLEAARFLSGVFMENENTTFRFNASSIFSAAIGGRPTHHFLKPPTNVEPQFFQGPDFHSGGPVSRVASLSGK